MPDRDDCEKYVTCDDCNIYRSHCHELCRVVRDSREDRIKTLEIRMESLEIKFDKKLAKLNSLAWAAVVGLFINLAAIIYSHIIAHINANTP